MKGEVRGRGGGRGGANRCLPLSVAFCDASLHPSTSSSPSRYRRPPSRSPALSADSVLENVKSDFAREVFFFLFIFGRRVEEQTMHGLHRLYGCQRVSFLQRHPATFVCVSARVLGLVLSHTTPPVMPAYLHCQQE